MNRITTLFTPKLSVLFLSLVVWELVALLPWSRGIVPGPLTVGQTIYLTRAEYVIHTLATLENAGIGLLCGAFLGCALAVLFVLWPEVRFLMIPLTLVFSTPLIMLVPIIGMSVSPSIAPPLCALLLVYYPMLLLFEVGLRNIPESVANYVLATGAGKFTVFRSVRIRYALPGLAAGLRTAIPGALLGSMLGELTGVRWGLGSYLAAIMVQGAPTREWSLFVVITLVTGGAVSFSDYFLKKAAVGPTPVGPIPPIRSPRWHLLAGIISSLLLWQFVSHAASNPFFVKRPKDILVYLLHLTFQDRATLIKAVGQTFEWAGLGFALGLVIGFCLAVLLFLYPRLGAPVMALTFITQSIPIVALVPLYVAIFSRGPLVTLAITVAATFFLAFASIYEGLLRTPQTIVDFARSTGTSRLSTLTRVRVFSATPFLFVAARLAAPRVLLGVTLAEYLATRQGLGAQLFAARGTLNFSQLWAIALFAGIVSMIFTDIVQYFENHASSRFLSRA